jgi:hypothetical protein
MLPSRPRSAQEYKGLSWWKKLYIYVRYRRTYKLIQEREKLALEWFEFMKNNQSATSVMNQITLIDQELYYDTNDLHHMVDTTTFASRWGCCC